MSDGGTPAAWLLNDVWAALLAGADALYDEYDGAAACGRRRSLVHDQGHETADEEEKGGKVRVVSGRKAGAFRLAALLSWPTHDGTPAPLSPPRNRNLSPPAAHRTPP